MTPPLGPAGPACAASRAARVLSRIYYYTNSGMISLSNLDWTREGEQMISFKGAHFEQDIILTCVRWYVAYPLSYRQLEELMQERGVSSTMRPSTAGS